MEVLKQVHYGCIIPEIKAGSSKSKALQTLIKSDKYRDIRYGVKFVKGNIGFENNIYTFPHFCLFLLRER